MNNLNNYKININNNKNIWNKYYILSKKKEKKKQKLINNKI